VGWTLKGAEREMRKPLERQFRIVSNFACLNLLNTELRQHGRRIDLLSDFSDLVAWLRAVGVLSNSEAREAETRWTGTAEGESAFAAAIDLRAALRTLAERLAQGKPVSDAAVDVINRVLASRPSHRRLVRDGQAFRTLLVPQAAKAIHLLAPVAESAADLLEHGEPSLIKSCENPSCVLYFYDTTKNRSRRWCSMEVCGSRIKAATYYRRKRASQAKAAATTPVRAAKRPD
jgi:predicted RNA-binding Zn ribbon-like protein